MVDMEERGTVHEDSGLADSAIENAKGNRGE